jgi:hypothetical protein
MAGGSIASGNKNSVNSDDAPPITPLSEQVTKKQLSRSWALLINEVYEIDALRCSRCNGEMAFKQFLCGQGQTKRMLAKFGITPFRATTAPLTASWRRMYRCNCRLRKSLPRALGRIGDMLNSRHLIVPKTDRTLGNYYRILFGSRTADSRDLEEMWNREDKPAKGAGR